MSALAAFVLAAMPYSMGVAVIGSLLIGYLARGVRADLAVIRARRLAATVRSLRADLAAERALVARLTAGTDDIIAAARGAHHRTQEGADRG